MRHGRYAALAVTAIFAAAAIAPTLAGATSRNDKYSGPIDLPRIPGDLPGDPSIEMTIKSKSKKKGKKLKPKFVSRLKLHNVYETCEDGTKLYPADNNSEFDITYGFEFEGAKIKHRKFATTDSQTSITLTGTVPKNGPATGTVRISEEVSGSGFDFGHCDTGNLNWTADKL